jgi:hypothetical protein
MNQPFNYPTPSVDAHGNQYTLSIGTILNHMLPCKSYSHRNRSTRLLMKMKYVPGARLCIYAPSYFGELPVISLTTDRTNIPGICPQPLVVIETYR